MVAKPLANGSVIQAMFGHEMEMTDDSWHLVKVLLVFQALLAVRQQAYPILKEADAILQTGSVLELSSLNLKLNLKLGDKFV